MIFTAAEVLTKCVPIFDRLISLVKAGDESRQNVIRDIVAPYFTELETAYTAYLATLRKARKMIERGESFPMVYSEIEEIRAADLILRDKVREMADAYGATTHSDITDFFNKAYNLFGYWNGDHHSGTLRILTALQDEPGTWSPEFLVGSIVMTIDAAEEQWRQLAHQYASIRLKYLQPTKVTAGSNRIVPKPKLDQQQQRPTGLLESVRTFLFP